MDDYEEIRHSRIAVAIGHSEYWSKAARLNLDAFVGEGNHAVILSGNTMWWQVRYNSDKKQLVCYKDASLDPEPDNLLKTINWPDTLLHYPVLNSIGADFVHGAYGMKDFHGWYGYRILSPASPLLEGTGLTLNQVLSCQSVELDGTLFYYFTPGGDPVLDTTTLGFCKIEMIGYDYGKGIYTWGPEKGYGTFIAFKKSLLSGNVVNTGFTNWCSKNGGQGAAGGFGGADSARIKKITLNILQKLQEGTSIFSVPENCPVTGNEDPVHGKTRIFVSPNPGTGEFHLSGEGLPGKPVRLELYNTIGRCVFSGELSKKDAYWFSVSFLPGGIYFYRTTNAPGTAGSGKVIIVK